MSKFQSAIGTISALVTISVTVGTVYYNFENKKSQDLTQQQQINQLQQKLNSSIQVEETPVDSYTSVIAPQSTPEPEPTIPTPPELPVVQSIPQLPSPPAPPAPPVATVSPAPPVPPVAQIQSVEIK